MASKREVRESQDKPMEQGINEECYYTLTTTPYASSPSSPECKAYDINQNYLDVTSTILEGSATADGDVITTPKVKSLTENDVYMVTIKFTAGSSVFQPYVRIIGKR